MTQELLQTVLSLPEAERVELAERLLRSLDPKEPAGGDIEAEWDRELERRLDDVESGRAKTRDWRESMADIRRRLESSGEVARRGRMGE